MDKCDFNHPCGNPVIMRRPVLYATTLIPAAMLVITLIGHRPYRHFIVLRLVVSIAAAVLALNAHKQNATGWMWVMIGVLVVFSGGAAAPWAGCMASH